MGKRKVSFVLKTSFGTNITQASCFSYFAPARYKQVSAGVDLVAILNAVSLTSTMQ